MRRRVDRGREWGRREGVRVEKGYRRGEKTRGDGGKKEG
jgi:hypothetical protein